MPIKNLSISKSLWLKSAVVGAIIAFILVVITSYFISQVNIGIDCNLAKGIPFKMSPNIQYPEPCDLNEIINYIKTNNKEYDALIKPLVTPVLFLPTYIFISLGAMFGALIRLVINKIKNKN